MADFQRLNPKEGRSNYDHFSVYFADYLEKLVDWKP